MIVMYKIVIPGSLHDQYGCLWQPLLELSEAVSHQLHSIDVAAPHCLMSKFVGSQHDHCNWALAKHDLACLFIIMLWGYAPS